MNEMSKIIAIASDHAGFDLKEVLKKELDLSGYKALDLGADSKESVDYPDFGYKLAEKVASGACEFGVLICGSGIGISIAANRNKKIRAALCHNKEMAKLARQHNNANVLALGAKFVDEQTAKDCLKEFLNTDFEGGRHEKRVEKLGI
jgi:ribose 5-phosphate isomerase B